MRSYDSRCCDLAEIFLSDEPRWLNTEHHRVSLAKAVQQAVETWLEQQAVEMSFSSSLSL
jgi:hypothetical protein